MLKHLVVVGLGYVGLPLALLADKKGFEVTGLDIDKKKIEALTSGHSYITDINDGEIKASKANYTTDPTIIEEASVVIVCVPTPVTKNKEPDLGPVRGAITAIAPHLQPETLVVLESTVNPGVSDEIVIPLLHKNSKLTVGKDLYLAYCPERINPGDTKWDVSNINRVIGANSDKELKLAKDVYESLIDAQIKPMRSLKEAEAVKIVENSFRDINIAFVNELAMSFHKLGIDIENVIEGASTKPFAFLAHHPGCGVGGHCIPVDPYYLIEYANGYGFDHEFLRLARKINDNMPRYTVDLLEEALNKKAKPLKGTLVALLGLSFKANVGDDRESPAYEIKQLMEERGAKVITYDPYISSPSGAKSLAEALKSAEAIVVATAHDEFKNNLTPEVLKENNVKVFIDGRNIARNFKDLFKAEGLIYQGIGV